MDATVLPASPAASALAPAAEARGISKRFGVVAALQDVSISLLGGEAHGLVGENGAGKSTLTKVLAGVEHPDSGEVLIAGERVHLSGPTAALERGVVVIYQELSLLPELSVAANVFLGHEPRKRGMLDERAMRATTKQLLGRLGAKFSPRRIVGELSVADQQLVEIARALNRRSRLIIMDEPTAALPTDAHEHLFAVIRSLREAGTAILYISHELADVFALCDRITVMKDGCRVWSGLTSKTDRDAVIRAMVGRPLGEMFPPRRARVDRLGTPALELKDLSLPGHFAHVDLQLHRGEVVGLAGLVGSGRTSLARTMFGNPPGYAGMRAVRGSLHMDGKAVRIRGVRDAIKRGIAYVPEERKTDGLALELTIADNIALPQLRNLHRYGISRRGAEMEKAREQVKALSIRTPSVSTEAGDLSGGNQQKIVLGKWLSLGCGVLLLDEPTRGIDVGAKVEIYNLLRGLTEQGMAILMISSDMPEVLGFSDRIAVMRRGRIVGEFEDTRVSEEQVIRLALGAEEVSRARAA